MINKYGSAFPLMANGQVPTLEGIIDDFMEVISRKKKNHKLIEYICTNFVQGIWFNLCINPMEIWHVKTYQVFILLFEWSLNPVHLEAFFFQI